MERAWWLTDSYTGSFTVPHTLEDPNLWGPQGPALAQVYPTGKTQYGWGESEFMNQYQRRNFIARASIMRFTKYGQPFAFIMRSANMVCIDIDGKNGGTQHEKLLGLTMPPTTAETSKSGNGYHLFYQTDDEWDDALGFAMFRDFINIEAGVDFRGTGCIFHHKQQRWNSRPLTPLPKRFGEKLLAQAEERVKQRAAFAAVLESGDKEEILMAQSALMDDLNRPIPDGRRNSTLFAIGSKLYQAGVPNWSQLIEDKAAEVGLDDEETDKLLANIGKYHANA